MITDLPRIDSEESNSSSSSDDEVAPGECSDPLSLLMESWTRETRSTTQRHTEVNLLFLSVQNFFKSKPSALTHVKSNYSILIECAEGIVLWT